MGDLELGRDVIVQSKHKSCLGAGPEGPRGNVVQLLRLGRVRAAELFFHPFPTRHSLILPPVVFRHLQGAQLSCQTPALITGPLPQFLLNIPTVHVFTRGGKKNVSTFY